MIDLHSEMVDRLFRAILKLETVDECYRFFEDVCTVKEIKDMAQRLYIAALLDNGMNYQSIAQTVEASSATISRVNKCLVYGSGGYRAVLDRMHASEEEE